MCGFAPAIIAIESSKNLGAQEGILIEHTHSGIVSGHNRGSCWVCRNYY